MKKARNAYLQFLSKIGKLPLGIGQVVSTSTYFYASLLTITTVLSLFFSVSKTLGTSSSSDSVSEKVQQVDVSKQGFNLKEIVPLSWYLGRVEDIPKDQLDFYVTTVGDQSQMQVCTERIVTENGQTQSLELDPFNPALGTLSQVEVVTEGMIIAEVDNSLATGTEYMLMLNASLEYELPDGSMELLELSSKYSQRTTPEYLNQQGFQASTWGDMLEARKVISSPLNPFLGQGKVQIPVTAQDLINFQNATSSIDSDLKVKVCLNYSFTPN